jgi:hypothetical protein
MSISSFTLKQFTMQDLELVVAELPNGTNNWMLNNKQCYVISDGALFMLTTKKNNEKYNYLEFSPVDNEILVEMKLEFTLLGNGKLLMFNYGETLDLI